MRVKGFSHITINVADLNRALDFYQNVLGMELRHRGTKDAYLEWGEAWICLLERSDYPVMLNKQQGIDHIAFYISEEHFHSSVETLLQHGVRIVRGPVERGTGLSVNFLDADGTELELHTSTLAERMKVWK